ncbi:MarR family winged helix-turn-helix transcriptional regulator [Dactylosporangium sp. CS-047395]|uniref:MarR family winged helix-turn-helix transcriptional regulator n=1 Tax=Dactylosporangium sp. CS-047395 TaxID=3239936 RepID=UPI003D8F7ED6
MVEPPELDLGTVALFTGYAAAAELMREVAAEGYGDVRFSHGYVFQHLVDASPTIGDLAARLDMTQQGASKIVAELERAGYVARVADVGDARVRRVELTPRGVEMLRVYRAARFRQEQRLVALYGAERLAAARALLVEVLEGMGGAEAVRRRDVRPPV